MQNSSNWIQIGCNVHLAQCPAYSLSTQSPDHATQVATCALAGFIFFGSSTSIAKRIEEVRL